jgi:hypothetical protein
MASNLIGQWLLCHLQSAKFFSDDAAPSTSLFCPAADAFRLSQLIRKSLKCWNNLLDYIRDSTTVGLLIYFDGYYYIDKQ